MSRENAFLKTTPLGRFGALFQRPVRVPPGGTASSTTMAQLGRTIPWAHVAVISIWNTVLPIAAAMRPRGTVVVCRTIRYRPMRLCERTVRCVCPSASLLAGH
jgi:hypothetical protein